MRDQFVFTSRWLHIFVHVCVGSWRPAASPPTPCGLRYGHISTPRQIAIICDIIRTSTRIITQLKPSLPILRNRTARVVHHPGGLQHQNSQAEGQISARIFHSPILQLIEGINCMPRPPHPIHPQQSCQHHQTPSCWRQQHQTNQILSPFPVIWVGPAPQLDKMNPPSDY